MSWLNEKISVLLIWEAYYHLYRHLFHFLKYIKHSNILLSIYSLEVQYLVSNISFDTNVKPPGSKLTSMMFMVSHR